MCREGVHLFFWQLHSSANEKHIKGHLGNFKLLKIVRGVGDSDVAEFIDVLHH